MTFVTQLVSGAGTAGMLLAAMCVVALVEAAVPLRAGQRPLAPNLALIALTIATSVVFNAALLTALMLSGGGLLAPFEDSVPITIVSIVALDFATYAAHVGMHAMPTLWRFHRVHHCDPHLDVTTALRQHPGESAIRYAALATTALGLGVPPAAFVLYRTWSALHAVIEHANVRVPRWLDRVLVTVVTTPHMHKVHHSRDAAETDTNYGSVFSIFDRLFGTLTPSSRGVDVRYGLDGYDDADTQRAGGLLALPFRRTTARDGVGVEAC